MLRALVICAVIVSFIVTGCAASAKRADWSPTADPNWANDAVVQEPAKPSWWEEHPWVKPTLIVAGVGLATVLLGTVLVGLAIASTLRGG